MSEVPVFAALGPFLLLLALGVLAALVSRAMRFSPIVGYLGLGLALKASGIGIVSSSSTITLLAQLGVVFLLFDIGLHFSLRHLREQAADIFGFGPLQVLLGTCCSG